MLTVLLLVLPHSAFPQALGLPLYHPDNPMAESRSGLYFQPYVDPHTGWSVSAALDYASVLELNFRYVVTDTAYLLDAEILRLNLQLGRDLGPNNYATVEAFFGGAYSGFLDGSLNWYHHFLGIPFPEREERPRNHFDYTLDLPGGSPIRRKRSGGYLGDLRLGVGHRYTQRLQSQLSVTLPTSTAPAGYGRGTISISLENTFRALFAPRWTYEGSLGLGYTPGHGDLSDYQNHTFLMLTSGLRYRFWGRLSGFANLYYHSPYYHGTDLPALDRADLSLDFGGILRTRNGREWRIGMTEDPAPAGPAVDLIFRVGTTW